MLENPLGERVFLSLKLNGVGAFLIHARFWQWKHLSIVYDIMGIGDYPPKYFVKGFNSFQYAKFAGRSSDGCRWGVYTNAGRNGGGNHRGYRRDWCCARCQFRDLALLGCRRGHSKWRRGWGTKSREYSKCWKPVCTR